MSANQNRHPEPNVWTPGCALGCATAALALGGLLALTGWATLRLVQVGEPDGSPATAAVLLLLGVPLVVLGLREAWRGKRAWGASPERLAYPEPEWKLRPLPDWKPRRGERLPVRLRQAQREVAWSTLAVAFMLLLANVFTLGALQLWGGARSHAGEQGVAVAFVVVLALVALCCWLIVLGVGWELANVLRRGRTLVELEREPLAPGERARLLLRQEGPLRAPGFRFQLVCEEVVTVSRGKGAAEHRHRVLEVDLAHQDAPRLRRGERWERLVTIEVPADAMHTFFTPDNEVRWRVILTVERGKFLGLRNHFTRDFGFCVLPDRARQALLAGTPEKQR